ncbi:MAG: hypothetical protein AAF656_01625 [Planctomycetota bacterium]
MAKHDPNQVEAATRPVRAERMPEIVIVLGIMGMMFAVSGLAYKLISLFAQRMHPADDLAGKALWWLTAIGIGVSVGLFIHAGLMLLRFDWGRVGMLIYAGLAIALTFPAAWVRIARTDEWMEFQLSQSNDVPEWAGTAGIMIHVVFAAVALVYPALLLYHLTRPRVRRAFRDARLTSRLTP